MTVEITATKQVVIWTVTRRITSSVLMLADVSLHHGNVMDGQIVMMKAMKAAVIQVRYLLSTRQRVQTTGLKCHKIFKIDNILEFHVHIWNHHEYKHAWYWFINS